jgi:hypothetical protein
MHAKSSKAKLLYLDFGEFPDGHVAGQPGKSEMCWAKRAQVLACITMPHLKVSP